VVLLLIAAGAGFAAGLARPRAGVHARRLTVRHVWLVGAGAVLHGASSFVDGDGAVVVLAGSLLALLAFALVNPQVTGIAVIGLGLLVNLVALVLNTGVPIRPEAMVSAGVIDRADAAAEHIDGARHVEASSDRLAVLGDVLPIRPARAVVSFGDLIIVAGVADAAREVARRRRRRWDDDERAGYVALTTLASVDHDWGTAPSGAPESGTQCSAYPEVEAPVTIDLDKEAAVDASPDLVAADQSR
jgi:hypothetical protein